MTQTKHQLPTGYLITDNYSKGMLETLSIGDYGKKHNVKADFLGYTRELSDGVPNTDCMPLSEKWVVTLSTQYGCPMKCTFCDVPNVKFRGNASEGDLWRQLQAALGAFPEVGYTDRLNIHFARMGEPIFNRNVFTFAALLGRHRRDWQKVLGVRVDAVHPVLTTSLPKTFKPLHAKLVDWCQIKNNLYRGQAGLQFSINSTNEKQRDEMFGGSSLSLADFAEIAKTLPPPLGRKYCLNFAYASGFEVDGKKLAEMFNPDRFMCKVTPIHNNNACRANKLETVDGYDSYLPYREPEKSLKEAGFDVLVFVPSMDEENGLVTCGNAILGGSKLKTQGGPLKIEGQAA